jgi:hypothetical protein
MYLWFLMLKYQVLAFCKVGNAVRISGLPQKPDPSLARSFTRQNIQDNQELGMLLAQ